MWKNYFRTAVRNLIRSKGYSLINIIGLAVGIAVCLLIFLFIVNELEYNSSHENLGRICRILTKHYYGSQQSWSTGSPPAVGPYLKENYPEVENSARFVNGTVKMALKHGDKLFYEEIQMADPGIFDIFTLPFTAGSHQAAKSNDFTIILSEKAAEKYFGTENPVGQFLLMDNQYEMEVIAVMKDIPGNSSVQFDYMVPVELTNLIWNENNTKTWYNCSFNTYILLADNVDREVLDDKIQNLINRNYPESDTETFIYPFEDLHLKLYGNIERVYTVGVIGLLILLIACINFVNLTTSRAIQRTREISMRKINGASRNLLIAQFMLEFMLLIFISIILALVMAELLSPVFNRMTGTQLASGLITNHRVIVFLPLLWLVTALISGIYPALLLASFDPLKTFRKNRHKFGVKSTLRKILVTLQFGLSITMIIITLFINQQSKFMRTRDLGYDRDNIVYVNLEGKTRENPEILRSRLLEQPGVEEVTFLGRDPTSIWTNGSGWDWEGRPEDVDPFVTYQGVDHNYLKTFGIEMAAGSFYEPGMSGSEYLVINESFARRIGREDPTGMTLYSDDEQATILGVVKDFHYKSNHFNIGPLILFLNTGDLYKFISFRYAYIKIRSENIPATIKSIEAAARDLAPDFPITVSFLESDLERLYRQERQTELIVTGFAFFAIFISCLGLLGLSTFLTLRRTREIGIRKVLGSTVPALVRLLTMNFLKWVLVANLFAWPLSYFFVKKWLEHYPFRIEIGIETFLAASLGTLLIAVVTIVYQTLKAANSNPVDALRYE